MIFWKEWYLLNTFGNSAKTNAAFCRIFFHGVLKTAFYFCKRSFWGKLLFWKNQFRSPFRTLRWKFSAIWQLFLDRVIVIAFYMPIGTLSAERVCLKRKLDLLYRFWTWREFFIWPLFKNFPCRIVKIAYYLSMETFWVDRTFVRKKMNFLINFQKWAKNHRVFVEFFRRSCQNGGVLLQEIILRKTTFLKMFLCLSFSNNERKVLSHLAETSL